jgi:hypothetical protein
MEKKATSNRVEIRVEGYNGGLFESLVDGWNNFWRTFNGQEAPQAVSPEITITVTGGKLTIGVSPTTGIVGTKFFFSGKLSTDGELIGGARVVLIVNGTKVGETTSGGAFSPNWSIPWVPTAPGTYTAHAEAYITV